MQPVELVAGWPAETGPAGPAMPVVLPGPGAVALGLCCGASPDAVGKAVPVGLAPPAESKQVLSHLL